MKFLLTLSALLVFGTFASAQNVEASFPPGGGPLIIETTNSPIEVMGVWVIVDGVGHMNDPGPFEALLDDPQQVALINASWTLTTIDGSVVLPIIIPSDASPEDVTVFLIFPGIDGLEFEAVSVQMY